MLKVKKFKKKGKGGSESGGEGEGYFCRVVECNEQVIGSVQW